MVREVMKKVLSGSSYAISRAIGESLFVRCKDLIGAEDREFPPFEAIVG